MYARDFPLIHHQFPVQLSLFLSLMLFLTVQHASATQSSDQGEIFREGSEDANILFKEYFKPFGDGFGADLNSGWFTSARPLQKFGIDLRVSVSASYVPSRDRFFDVTQLNLNTIRLLRGPIKTPTAFGEDTETSILGATNINKYTKQEEELFSFQMPEGSGYHFVPAPMAQFSLGLPGHSQITLRYTPTIAIDSDYKINMLGVGFMVGLNPLLFQNSLPIDLSLQSGVMNLNATSPFKLKPIRDIDIDNSYPNSHWDDQGIVFNAQSFVINIILGKSFSVFSFFAGAGYQRSTTDIKTTGSFPIVIADSKKTFSKEGPKKKIKSFEEPIQFTLQGTNKLHALGGFQIKIAFISLSAAYTFSEYSTVKAGVGITF